MAKTTEKYELMYIINPNLSEEETAAVVEKFKALVEQNGTLEEMEEMGKRKLAYEINYISEGYYVLVKFTTQSQIPVASFSLAVDRDFGGRDGGERQTDFIDIVAWRSTAEFVSKYFTKGSMAVVSGRLQIRDWTDREGGKRRSAEVVADNVYFGESKRRDGGDTSRPAAPSASAPAHRGSYGGYDNVPQGGSAFSELDDDDGDLPF